MKQFRELKKIYLASPRSFCAGVERAVKIVELLLERYGPPIYIHHQIVHNRYVISDLKKKGIIFVEDLKKIPNNAIVVFSAHGTSPKLFYEAKKKNLKVYDAICPLVRKVHLEAKRYARTGYFILYIGHKNHPEPLGVMGEVSKKSITLIENISQAKKIIFPQKRKMVVLTQTTLNIDEVKEIVNILKKRFPKLIVPPTLDICFSTQNRQNAVKKLIEIKKVQLILVVGSKESSNSKRLKETAEKKGIPAYLVNDWKEIDDSWFANIKALGITGGASTPEKIIQEVVNYLKKKKEGIEVEEFLTVKENIRFPLPISLSRL